MSTISSAVDAGKSHSCDGLSMTLQTGLLTVCIVVARVAYFSSDIILSVQPALNIDSDFSRQLHLLATSKAPGIITRVPDVSCSMLA